MNRLGRGYSFEALRAKILFSEGAFKKGLQRPKFERRMGYGNPDLPVMFRMASGIDSNERSTEDEATEVNYGVDISILTRMIEAGEN